MWIRILGETVVNMKKSVLAFILVISLSAYAAPHEVSDTVKFKMFCCAIGKLFSNRQNYVVIRVKNLNTGEVKDLCTTPDKIDEAIAIESGKYIELDCMRYPERYFEFSKDDALQIIGFKSYVVKEFEAFRKTINVDSIVRQIEDGEITSVHYGDSEKYFAHIMFNVGMCTITGCFPTSSYPFDPSDSCED